MPRLLFAIATTLCCAVPFADQACASTNVVSHSDRTIIKEPTYQSTPKYSLLTLGNSGDVKVWMVEDGKRLFVDKNANGDMTDDGPPIEPSKAHHNGRYDARPDQDTALLVRMDRSPEATRLPTQTSGRSPDKLC